MRIAVSTVAFERKLFPEDTFRDRTLAGVQIKSLAPEDDGAAMLISWLEEGVFEGITERKSISRGNERMLMFGNFF
tara:strand:+ start:707 stop:934 length:228 start_codon:yes stop_codon:yes gene_type:complete